MPFELLNEDDFPYLHEFEPPGWGDLVPRFKYAIDSSFCKTLKMVIAGEMVAVGSTIFHQDSAWLASIIVHPDHRNKGYGNKITQALIDTVDRDKYSTIYLDATELGYPVYVKLGFALETTYAHFKSAANITGLQLSNAIINYNDQWLEQILQLDKNISCEDRAATITENLATTKLYVNSKRVEGFYMPSLGNGLILAENDIAGIELIKYRLENNYYAILPRANKAATDFLQQYLTEFRTSRRMFIGKKRDWKMDCVYNRISGQLG